MNTATVVPFPRAGTPLLRRDQRLLTGLGELQHRLDRTLQYIRAGDLKNAEALCMVADMETAELEGIVLGVQP